MTDKQKIIRVQSQIKAKYFQITRQEVEEIIVSCQLSVSEMTWKEVLSFVSDVLKEACKSEKVHFSLGPGYRS